MEKLTKKEAVRLHREMWKIISEMTDEEIEEQECSAFYIKDFALRKMGYNTGNEEIMNNCFCCKYDSEYGIVIGGICSLCPIKWKSNKCFNGEFDDFCSILRSRNFNEIRSLAKQISELPEREDTKYDII